MGARVVVVVAASWIAGCAYPALDLEGRRPPCVAGYVEVDDGAGGRACVRAASAPDAAVDAPIDAGSDAGPPCADASEGDPCTDGAHAGVCHAGSCCAGCWDGETCAAGRGATEVAAGGGHTCALDRDGVVWCFGSDGQGELGQPPVTGEPSVRARPEPIGAPEEALPRFVAIAAGEATSYAIDEGGALWSWGYRNRNGRAASLPGRVEMGADVRVARAIAGPGFHACAITIDFDAYCWGDDSAGQVGCGEAICASPHRLPDTRRWSDLAVSELATCGLSTSTPSRASCWGSNARGELGQGTTAPVTGPVAVDHPDGRAWIDVAAGRYVFVARDDQGDAYAWGSPPACTPAPTGAPLGPTRLDLPMAVDAMEMGGDHLFVRVRDGTVYAWGCNAWGQLAIDPVSATPIDPPIDVRATTAPADPLPRGGLWHSCAITAGGFVACAGVDCYGQLGYVPEGAEIVGAACPHGAVEPSLIRPAWTPLCLGAE